MHGFDFSVPFFHTRIRGTCIAITLQLVADVLHVPRVKSFLTTLVVSV